MNKNLIKAGVYIILVLLIAGGVTPVITGYNSTHYLKSNLINRYSKLEQKNNSPLGRGWDWLHSYPNYAPNGIPDFDQHQNEWKIILPGKNGVIDSSPIGDDFYNPNENCIVPGPNCHLETYPAGDDYTFWAFSGPAAVANCFWWLDSKNSDQNGTPGDGEDNYPLVKDYGVGDDHLPGNAPLLIENLANTMQTSSKGKTYIQDMKDGISDWFANVNLSNQFTVNISDKPSFNFIKNQIKNNSNVILLLGQYKAIRLVDQNQSDWDTWVDLTNVSPGQLQNFTPTSSKLDTVELLLVGSQQNWTTVEVSIYDTLPNDPNIIPLAVTMKVVNLTLNPEWVQFDFQPSINLIPGKQYIIAVRALDNPPYKIHWCHTLYNSYPNGISWWCIYNYVLEPKINYDFAFKTLYRSNDCIRYCDHYVTCAGVNSEESKIALSDPYFNIQNYLPSYTSYNDPINVSYDPYNVAIGSPSPTLHFKWWLTDYPTNYQEYNIDYTVVEQAVIVNALENIPPVVTITRPVNGIYIADHYIIGFFLPLIIGKITIEAEASDNQTGIKKVEFSINNVLQETVTAPPYNWTWRKSSLGIESIQVTAYDNAGNKATKEMFVVKFF